MGPRNCGTTVRYPISTIELVVSFVFYFSLGLATLDENRRIVGMLSPIRDKNEGTYRGGEGTTQVTTACSEDR